MKTNIKQFLRDFKVSQQKTLDASAKVINKTLLDMYKKIIDRTPVGDPSLWNYPAPPGYTPGTLKASWQINFNTRGAIRDARGRFASFKGLQSAGGLSFKVGSNRLQNAIIFNSQPYAQRVETGEWSTQAPQGMMRITIAEYASNIQKNAMRYRIR